jgi:cytochrome c oxidase subunit II
VRRTRSIVPLAALAAAIACAGPQRALDTAGPAAERIATLWWVMLALASAVCVLVTVLLVHASRVSRRRATGEERAEVNGTRLVAGLGVAMPVVVVLGVLVYSHRVGVEVHRVPGDPAGAVLVEVVGHQFWWEARYPELGIATANEIRIPAGRPVRFRLTSPDVIHSFWVPQLHGKIDLVPGRVNTLWVRADRPGRFRGQCAEYCGMSHALMAVWVEALGPEPWEAWVRARTTPAPEPDVPGAARGREVFFQAGCGECHATRGAPLAPELGTPGPDLADLATRRTLAAGTLPNNPGALGGWITDPQRRKPGNRMPPTLLAAEDLQALVTYLGTLR